MNVPGGNYHIVTLQNAVGATGDGTPIAPTDITKGAYTTLTLYVKGTFSATLTWEASDDGVTWHPIRVENLETGSFATTATAVDVYRVVVAGLMQFRARVSAYTSGNVTVVGVLCA